MAERALHGLIREAYETLSPADCRLADLILNFPGELPSYSASELARMALTSKAAVSRFVRRLGFANYEEMRRRAREELESGTPVYLIGQGPPGNAVDLLDRHAKAAAENIKQTAAAVDRVDFAALIDRIATARQVWIAGFRHGFAIANYLRWSLAHTRSDVRLLPAAGDTFGEHLVDLGPDDVLVVVALRRRVPAIAALTKLAAQAGAPVAVITDPGMIDTQHITWTLRIFSQTRGPVDDHASVLMIAHAITEHVIARLGPLARDRFARIDGIHEALEEL